MQHTDLPQTVFGFPAETNSNGKPKMVPGMSGTDRHPNAMQRNPSYVFPYMATKDLIATRAMEMARPDTQDRRHLMIHGPRGSGKTSLVEQFHAAIGVPLVILAGGDDTDLASAVQNKTTRTAWRTVTKPDGTVDKEPIGIQIIDFDGAIAQSMREGIPLLVDEAFRIPPEKWVRFNRALERGTYTIAETGEVIVAKRGWMVFLTDNTNGNGDDSGSTLSAQVQEVPFLDRFDSLYLEYADEAGELALLRQVMPQADAGLCEKGVKLMAAFNRAIDSAKEGVRPRGEFSRRALHAFVRQVPLYVPLAAHGIDPVAHVLNKVYIGKEPRALWTTLHELAATVIGGTQ